MTDDELLAEVKRRFDRSPDLSNDARNTFMLDWDGRLWLHYSTSMLREGLLANPLVCALIQAGWTLRENPSCTNVISAHGWSLVPPPMIPY